MDWHTCMSGPVPHDDCRCRGLTQAGRQPRTMVRGRIKTGEQAYLLPEQSHCSVQEVDRPVGQSRYSLPPPGLNNTPPQGARAWHTAQPWSLVGLRTDGGGEQREAQVCRYHGCVAGQDDAVAGPQRLLGRQAGWGGQKGLSDHHGAGEQGQLTFGQHLRDALSCLSHWLHGSRLEGQTAEMTVRSRTKPQ